MKKIFFLFLLFISIYAWSADPIEVYPSNWWVGMKLNKIQLMIHAQNATNIIPAFKLPAGGTKLADGIMLKGVHHVENPNYVFLDIEIAKTAKPGMRKFEFVLLVKIVALRDITLFVFK